MREDVVWRTEVDVPTVVLSLDDGYAENLTGLRAVAESEDVPVTICVGNRPKPTTTSPRRADFTTLRLLIATLTPPVFTRRNGTRTSSGVEAGPDA